MPKSTLHNALSIIGHGLYQFIRGLCLLMWVPFNRNTYSRPKLTSHKPTPSPSIRSFEKEPKPKSDKRNRKRLVHPLKSESDSITPQLPLHNFPMW